MDAEEFVVFVGDMIWGAVEDDFAFFDEDGTRTETTDGVHVVGNEDDGLAVVAQRFEVIVALLLESGITDGEDFVEEENVAVSADGDGKSKTDLHARGVVLELLVLERLKFGELPDVVIHGVHLVVGETKKGAVHVDVFAAGEFWVETDTKLDERDEAAVYGDVAFLGVVDAGEDFEKSGLTGTVATDDADEFAFFDVKIEAS